MMKKTLLTLLLGTLACGAAMAISTSPSALQTSSAVVRDAAQGTQSTPLTVDDQLARRKPRVPGGSGCDDPDDLIEHPECRPNATTTEDQLARRKPRVPGGSGSTQRHARNSKPARPAKAHAAATVQARTTAADAGVAAKPPALVASCAVAQTR
jgi:hypothetical protein